MLTPAIRSAGTDDGPVLADIIRESFRHVAEKLGLTPDNAPTHPSNCKAAWVQAALDKGVRYYILDGDEPACGCVALERHDEEVCYLERLAVLPRSQRQGHGAALARHAIQEARALGADRVEIHIIAEETELEAWYARLGFVVARRGVTLQHLPFEVTYMAMTLGA